MNGLGEALCWWEVWGPGPVPPPINPALISCVAERKRPYVQLSRDVLLLLLLRDYSFVEFNGLQLGNGSSYT